MILSADDRWNVVQFGATLVDGVELKVVAVATTRQATRTFQDLPGPTRTYRDLPYGYPRKGDTRSESVFTLI